MDYRWQYLIKDKKETDCEICGKHFVLTKNTGWRFCSKDCYFEWKHRRREALAAEKSHPVCYTICDVCGNAFETKNPKQKRCSVECQKEASRRKSKELYIDGLTPKNVVCKRCGEVFLKTYKSRLAFCSDSCARAYAKYNSKKKYKGKYENYNPVRTYKVIFKRDRGLCQLCGLPVIEDKFADNYWSGTVDHIVPVSKGGLSSLENCQLAHRICNSLKNNDETTSFIDWEELGKLKRWADQLTRLEGLTTPRGGQKSSEVL